MSKQIDEEPAGWRYWKALTITPSGFEAELPIIRSDSVCHQITNLFWGVYTPSTGLDGALLIGRKEDCEGAIKFYGEEQ